jgi:hypothetical protein
MEHNQLKENEDYYYENGYMVFTAKYLLARGYCCNNGCRHCPYKDVEKKQPDENIQKDSPNSKSEK